MDQDELYIVFLGLLSGFLTIAGISIYLDWIQDGSTFIAPVPIGALILVFLGAAALILMLQKLDL